MFAHKHKMLKGQRAGHTRGIMLVEMLVAFGIVSVTFVVIVNAYLQSSRATQIAQRQAEFADALSYALADMAREAQVSGNYSRPNLSEISMERVAGLVDVTPGVVGFRKDGFRLVKTEGGQDIDMLPPSIKLVTLQAAHNPAVNPDTLFITILVEHVEASDIEPDIVVQTTLVSRVSE